MAENAHSISTSGLQRRTVLRGLAAGAVAVLPIVAFAASDEQELVALEKELQHVHHERQLTGDEEKDMLLYDQHWNLRQRINGIQATSVVGLKAKATAAAFALDWDEDCDCVTAGSFVELTRSMIADIHRL